jgi:hypothetical protein
MGMQLKTASARSSSKPEAVLLPKYGGAEKEGKATLGSGSIADVVVRMGSVVATTHDDVSVVTENTLKSFC